MPPRKPTSKLTSFRLTAEARRLLGEIAEHQGLNMTAALEVLIRKEAKQQTVGRRLIVAAGRVRRAVV